jgi:pyruvate formate lyase activating enzyme
MIKLNINMAKESYLYKKLSNSRTQCQTCAHRCLISPGRRGICGVRENQNGKLYALNYGKIITMNVDPVEKKPLFHFLPGSHTLSIATVGCNLSCKNCQNYDISQGFKKTKEIPGGDFTPEQIVNEAIKRNLPSISYTYTEPTIFLEFAFDCMKIARRKGLKNIWVSNGFMTKESAELIIPYLDANNIDIKSFSEKFYMENCGAKLKPILETAKLMKKSGVWVEITTLSIPTLSDSEKTFKEIAKFIYKELGAETPWHISQFSGEISWKLQGLPETPIETLKTAYKIGKKTGLKYVYTGNVLDLPSEDTFCPKCNALTIDRTGYLVKRFDKNGKCQKCGTDLNLTLN